MVIGGGLWNSFVWMLLGGAFVRGSAFEFS